MRLELPIEFAKILPNSRLYLPLEFWCEMKQLRKRQLHRSIHRQKRVGDDFEAGERL